MDGHNRNRDLVVQWVDFDKPGSNAPVGKKDAMQQAGYCTVAASFPVGKKAVTQRVGYALVAANIPLVPVVPVTTVVRLELSYTWGWSGMLALLDAKDAKDAKLFVHIDWQNHTGLSNSHMQDHWLIHKVIAVLERV
jgi:hypothetical protein